MWENIPDWYYDMMWCGVEEGHCISLSEWKTQQCCVDGMD